MYQPRARSDRQLTALLLDEQELVRLGLRTLLEGQRTVTVVGEAGAIADALECAVKLRPTLVITGPVLADGDAVEACRRFTEEVPDTRVAVLGDEADEATLEDVVRAGACAYLSARMRGADLCHAVRAIATSEPPRDAGSRQALVHRRRRGVGMRDDLSTLAPQERRVLRLVAEGKTNKEIGAALHLSEKTVKNYLSHTFEKLQVSRRAQAAVLLVRDRLGLAPGPPAPDGGAVPAGPWRSGRPDQSRAPALPLDAHGVAGAAGPGGRLRSRPGPVSAGGRAPGPSAMVVLAGAVAGRNGRR
jgi:two-component system response regulator DevR